MTHTVSLEVLATEHPEVAALIEERDRYLSELREHVPNFANLGDVPPGHYYSPIPSLDDVRKNEKRHFETVERTLPGMDFREDAQVALIHEFADRFYPDMPFQPEEQSGMRFYFENVMFSYGDATSLHCMIRHLQPKRIIEVGSGFSSAVMLDTNDRFFGGNIETTFIEPNNERLLSLLKDSDTKRSRIEKVQVQDVDISVFAQLQANDILFIDSSHVSKIGSDVNRIIFDVLPMLASGVHIHFHDVFLPFEYPAPWIYEGRAWNEAYLLRAFLQYNQAFEVVLMNTFIGHFHAAFMNERMPLFMRNPGASFWIRKK